VPVLELRQFNDQVASVLCHLAGLAFCLGTGSAPYILLLLHHSERPPLPNHTHFFTSTLPHLHPPTSPYESAYHHHSNPIVRLSAVVSLFCSSYDATRSPVAFRNHDWYGITLVSHHVITDPSAQPAFTPVPARRTLIAQTTQNVSPAALSCLLAMACTDLSQPPPPEKVKWPQPVRDYVQRSFAPEAKISGIELAEMEVQLKTTITEAAELHRMDEIDWATYPLPQQLIQQERSMRSTWNQGPTDMSWDIPEVNDFAPTKKRKLDDEGFKMQNETNSLSLPPWRNGDRSKGFGERITYANQTQATRVEKRVRKQQEALIKGTGNSKHIEKIEKRKQRFGAQRDSSPPTQYPSSRSSTIDDEPIGPVVGTCQRLEKNYFRLTSAPKPEEIRPQEVLEKTLVLLKSKWKKEGNYLYICDQFKSLRQDLTVQHIKNSFTIEVYELHARIALEHKDLGEYNQCQTQLRALYSLDLGGHPAEFLAYRILYFIFTQNRTGLNDVLADITPELKKEPALRHALAMRSAVASGNYHKFFRLYLDVPNMGAYLVDQFITRERLAALAGICRA
jgi:hypothetical protein